MDKKTALQIGNIITPLACFVVLGVTALDFGDVFSDSGYSNLINPAPWTFAIWGPIFIFQFSFWAYQARDLLKKKEEKIDMPYVHEVSVFFMLSWISTTAWYLLWGSGYVLPSVLAMYAYLLTSLGAYIGVGANLKQRPRKEYLSVVVPWSMLTGWITVAAIVNTTTGLVSLGFNPAPIGEAGWTIIVLAVALVIYLLVLFRRNDYVFAGVGLWALIGVLGERLNPSNPPQPSLVLVAIIGIAVLAGAMLIRLYIQRKRS
jgi:hypothetical protein